MEPITIFNLALWGLVICAVAASFWLASAPEKLREEDVRKRQSMEQPKISSKNEE